MEDIVGKIGLIGIVVVVRRGCIHHPIVGRGDSIQALWIFGDQVEGIVISIAESIFP